MVGGKLHNKRGGLACEGLGLFKDDAADDNGRNADKVCRNRNKRAAVEHRCRDKTYNGHFCSAGDEAGGHNRHAAVIFVFNGTGCHDAGDGAAGADEHGDEALSGKTEFPENPVHDESYTRHIADILKDGEAQKQYQHLRHEAEDCADTAYNSVNNKACKPRNNADCLKP